MNYAYVHQRFLIAPLQVLKDEAIYAFLCNKLTILKSCKILL